MSSINIKHETEDCIKKWESDLRKATNALVKKQAELNKAQKKYENAQTWDKKLESLFKDLKQTDERSANVLEEIGVLSSILEKVCENTACVKEVVEILYCMIKEFYECTDQLKQKLTNIKREIECLNDPGLNASTSIVIKCIEDLCAKIDEAIKSQQELIKKLIEVVKCTCELYESLCGEDCSLSTIIVDLETLFSQGPGEANAECKTDSCNANLQPKPTMPLNCDPFYKQINDQTKNAEKELEEAKKEYSDLRKERDKLLSLKNSLAEAIKAAQAAKACK